MHFTGSWDTYVSNIRLVCDRSKIEDQIIEVSKQIDNIRWNVKFHLYQKCLKSLKTVYLK